MQRPATIKNVKFVGFDVACRRDGVCSVDSNRSSLPRNGMHGNVCDEHNDQLGGCCREERFLNHLRCVKRSPPTGSVVLLINHEICGRTVENV